MNKFLTTLVCLCFAIGILSAQSYSGGSGTESAPLRSGAGYGPYAALKAQLI
jgi:hypothetical protein